MKTYMMNIEESIVNSNIAKDIVLDRLFRDKVITEDAYDEYSDKWVMIIVNPNLFKRWKYKFLKTKTELIIRFVRFED